MQLLETISYNSGKFSNIELHQKRFNDSRRQLFNCKDEINLISILNSYIKKQPDYQLLKCRVVYNAEIESVEFIPYRMPNITSLKIVNCNEIEYRL